MNKLRFVLSIAATLFIFLTFSLITQAQTRTFVSGTGNDANNCSRATPCRTFQRGHNAVQAGGEVVALDSAGYGTMTITKSVTITGEGVQAGIAATSGDAVTIATAGIDVVLRSLSVQGGGTGSYGINVTSVGNLHVEKCVISGFTGVGIWVKLTADGSYIFIKDTITRNNGNIGVSIETNTGIVRASIDNCRSERNAGFAGYGFVASINSRVTINRSVASGNTAPGGIGFYANSFGAGATTELNCEECVSSNNADGFVVDASNGAASTIRISHSTATNNTSHGFQQLGDGVFNSLGNNLVRGNGTDTSGTITPITSN